MAVYWRYPLGPLQGERRVPVFSKARSDALAMRVAGVLGGRVRPCRVSFGLLTTARYCVKATYSGMRFEAYVFEPWLEA